MIAAEKEDDVGGNVENRGEPANRATGILSLTSSELQGLRRSPASGEGAIQMTRQHNLSVIRRLLYANGPQSRPELARLSGLSTPTVGALVAELVDDVVGAREGVAVALDGAVVPASTWEDTHISEGAEVDVLTAVQGG